MEISAPQTNLESETSDLIRVNVRGFHFEFECKLLRDICGTEMAKVINEKVKKSGKDRIPYINRDPFIFSSVLDFFESGELHVFGEPCAVVLGRELAAWGIEERRIEACCRLRLHDQKDMTTCMQTFMAETRKENEIAESVCSRDMGTSKAVTAGTQGVEGELIPVLSKRTRMWRSIEGKSPCTHAKIYNCFINTVNIIFIIFTTLSTLPDCRVAIPDFLGHLYSPEANITSEADDESEEHSVLRVVTTTSSHLSIVITECVCIVILTFDVVLRLVISPKTYEYLRNFVNVVSILTIVFYWVSTALVTVLLVKHGHASSAVMLAYHVFNSCRPLRVICLFQVVRYYGTWKLVKWSLQQSKKELLLLLGLLGICALIFGSIIYLAEMMEDSIWSIPQGIWWAFITMTTVGYGDIILKSPYGKVVGVCCAITGIVCVALPVPIIANNFNKFYKVQQLAQRMEQEHKDSVSNSQKRTSVIYQANGKPIFEKCAKKENTNKIL